MCYVSGVRLKITVLCSMRIYFTFWRKFMRILISVWFSSNQLGNETAQLLEWNEWLWFNLFLFGTTVFTSVASVNAMRKKNTIFDNHPHWLIISVVSTIYFIAMLIERNPFLCKIVKLFIAALGSGNIGKFVCVRDFRKNRIEITKSIWNGIA